MGRVLYVVEFSIRGNHGKNKATTEKEAAFTQLFGDSFCLLSMGRGHSLIAYSVFFSKLLWRLVSFRPKTVYYRGAASFACIVFCRFFGVKLIVECHASFVDEAKVLGLRGVRRWVMMILELCLRTSLRLNDGVIFNNPRLMRHYARLVPSIVRNNLVSHNGTDTSFFVPGDKSAARGLIGLPENAVVLIFVGSQSVWHGTGNLIRLSEEFGRLGCDVVVLIAGGSDSCSTCGIERRSNNLFVMGYVSKSIAMTAIHASDACLLPVNDCRVSPGSPLKLFDYASCGRTIITQRETEGYSDIVARYRIGHCLDFNDPRECARVILELINGGGLVVDQKYIRRVAEDNFDWKGVISNWVRFVDASGG
jgi:glycosyltransferase involved in cell wall biosynthesis